VYNISIIAACDLRHQSLLENPEDCEVSITSRTPAARHASSRCKQAPISNVFPCIAPPTPTHDYADPRTRLYHCTLHSIVDHFRCLFSLLPQATFPSPSTRHHLDTLSALDTASSLASLRLYTIEYFQYWPIVLRKDPIFGSSTRFAEPHFTYIPAILDSLYLQHSSIIHYVECCNHGYALSPAVCFPRWSSGEELDQYQEQAEW